MVVCPNCGARLITFSDQPPSRLICVGCGVALPAQTPPPLWLWVQLNLGRVVMLLTLLFTPLLLLLLSPAVEGRRARRSVRYGRPSSSRLLNRQSSSTQQLDASRRRQSP